jgi:hypothetical protein
MINKRIKDFKFLMGDPTDVFHGHADIIVTLEGDESKYFLEAVTPTNLIALMQKEKKNFVGPGYPLLIVNELSPSVIREALEEFATDSDDDFWIKLYSLAGQMEIDDCNFMLKRIRERQEEEDKDEPTEEE